MTLGLQFTAATWLHHSIILALHRRDQVRSQAGSGPPCALVRLVDQPNGRRAGVQANPWPLASLPAVERIAHCSEIGRGDGGAREGLVAIGSGEPHNPVLHCEDGVAPCDLPLAVSTVTGEAIADLDGTENAARRAQGYRCVVLNRAFMRAPAELGASHLRLLAGQVKEHVQPVRAQVSKAPTAGLRRIEHPGAIPGLIACRPRPADPNVDVRQPAY